MNRLIDSIKWAFFRALNRLQSKVKSPSHPAITTSIYNYQKADQYLWVFCSTIGEVNACRPLLDQLYKRNEKLVLLTDRNCYKDSYLNLYPESVVVELTGDVDEHSDLCSKLPPACFIVCEIPCSVHDAPCRLSYGLLRAVKKMGKPVYLVNGWLYGYAPSCRMDTIETTLFKKLYAQIFDRLTVQTDEIKTKLIITGVDPDRIAVTGNMKFDSVNNIQPVINDILSREILDNLCKEKKTILIAGCLVDQKEFSSLVKIHKYLKKQHGDLISILAPRHPEYPEVMKEIHEIVEKSELKYQYRSKMTSGDINNLDLIILDTIGELKAFFYCGDICYMGQNHNILEPLSFNKPVFTLNGWESTYPSYPVYRIAVEKGLIHCSDTFDEMSKAMLTQLEHKQIQENDYIEQQLSEVKGATKSNLAWLSLT